MSENEYTTKRGRRLAFIGIQGLLDRFAASHHEPKPPEYEVSMLGGRIEKHPLTEVKDRTSLNDDERAQLVEYEQRLAQYNERTAGEFLNLVLQRGVDIGSDGDAWAREQKEQFGIDVPDDPIERRMHYIQTEVLYGSSNDVKEDIGEIVAGVLIASGVDREKVAQLEATFRSQVGLDAAASVANQSGALVIQREIPRGRRGYRKDGQADQLVRRPKRR